jgi:single-strand selective monofunctional uracil DNA glycosylase
MSPPLLDISERLRDEIRDLDLTVEKAAHVYHVFDYAWEPWADYVRRYGSEAPREVLLVGINPGPWGMAQTGVPFGEVELVRDWLEIEGEVGQPEDPHPKKEVEGFSIERREVSGKRLWGWARDRFERPERFFEQFFVYNYCPVLLLEDSGRNLTPNRLLKARRDELLPPCDRALAEIVEFFEPDYVVAVGAFIEERLEEIFGAGDEAPTIGRILHPSPANPAANQGWAEQAEEQLRELGIELRA